MGVPQYTTPTFRLTFDQEGIDLTEAEQVYVTFKSGANVITKSGESLTIEEKAIGVNLTQSDTGKFRTGEVEIQANWTIGETRIASQIVYFPISEQLLRRVIET